MDPQLEKARLENGREKPVKNVDLWQRLDAALGQHKIKWEWVKGHAGHPENERCDELARRGGLPSHSGRHRLPTGELILPLAPLPGGADCRPQLGFRFTGFHPD